MNDPEQNLQNIIASDRYESNNIDEAIKIYKYLIDLGNTDAMISLGNIYCDRINNNHDYTEKYRVTKLFNKLFGGYNVRSDKSPQTHFHVFEQYGKINVDEAIKLYKMAANKKNAHAIYILGYLYKDGRCIDQDYNLAAKYYGQLCDCENEILSRYFDLKQYDVMWTKNLHKYWPNKQFIGKQIIVLFLISKCRFRYQNLGWMVKGIVDMIVVWLGTFEKDIKV